LTLGKIAIRTQHYTEKNSTLWVWEKYTGQMDMNPLYILIQMQNDHIKKHPFFKWNALAGQWWLILVILVTWETEIERIMVQGQPRLMVHKTPNSKIMRAKWTRGVAQATEYLLCKHKVLSLNPSPTQKKRYYFA
jgi:hypothetical protein